MQKYIFNLIDWFLLTSNMHYISEHTNYKDPIRCPPPIFVLYLYGKCQELVERFLWKYILNLIVERISIEFSWVFGHGSFNFWLLDFSTTWWTIYCTMCCDWFGWFYYLETVCFARSQCLCLSLRGYLKNFVYHCLTLELRVKISSYEVWQYKGYIVFSYFVF